MLKKPSNAGFTVLEILVGIAVLGFAIPAIVLALHNLIVLNNRARDLALVNIIASNKTEQIRSAGYNSLTAGTVDFSSELPSEIASPKTATYTVTTPSTGIAEVVVTISYKDYNSTRTRTYQTTVSELGVGQ